MCTKVNNSKKQKSFNELGAHTTTLILANIQSSALQARGETKSLNHQCYSKS